MMDTSFFCHGECKISSVSWRSGKLDRVARSSNATELLAAADGQHSSVAVGNVRRYGQEVAANVLVMMILDSH